MGVLGALGRARNRSNQDLPLRTCASRPVVPALRRTIHPFAASGSEEPSPKIEFVFSASPETIRGEPPEFDLLRTVGYLQDLAVCAPSDPDVFSFLGRFLGCRSAWELFRRHEVLFSSFCREHPADQF